MAATNWMDGAGRAVSGHLGRNEVSCGYPALPGENQHDDSQKEFGGRSIANYGPAMAVPTSVAAPMAAYQATVSNSIALGFQDKCRGFGIQIALSIAA